MRPLPVQRRTWKEGRGEVARRWRRETLKVLETGAVSRREIRSCAHDRPLQTSQVALDRGLVVHVKLGVHTRRIQNRGRLLRFPRVGSFVTRAHVFYKSLSTLRVCTVVFSLLGLCAKPSFQSRRIFFLSLSFFFLLLLSFFFLKFFNASFGTYMYYWVDEGNVGAG